MIEASIGLLKPFHHSLQIQKSPGRSLLKESNRSNDRQATMNGGVASGTVIHQDGGSFDFLRQTDRLQLARVHIQRKQRRSRAGENFRQCRVVGLQVSSRIIQRHSASLEEISRLPIVQSQHLANLPMGESSGPITFNRCVLHDVTTHRVRGFSPLTRNLIGQFHGHLHSVGSVPRCRPLWQATEIHRPTCRPRGGGAHGRAQMRTPMFCGRTVSTVSPGERVSVFGIGSRPPIYFGSARFKWICKRCFLAR